MSDAMPERSESVDDDDVILIGGDRVVRLTFQSEVDPGFGHRMLRDWLCLARMPELAGRSVEQHVVVLGDADVASGIDEPNLSYSYTVHAVRDLHAERLLGDPAWAPLAALAQPPPGSDRAAVLRAAFDLIAAVGDSELQRALAVAAASLARVRLALEIIDRAWNESSLDLSFPADEELCGSVDEEAAGGPVGSLLRSAFRCRLLAATGRGDSSVRVDPDEVADHGGQALCIEDLVRERQDRGSAAQPGDLLA